MAQEKAGAQPGGDWGGQLACQPSAQGTLCQGQAQG